MELLTGCDLWKLVQTQGPLDPARALYLVTQAASALAEAHRFGIVHRDIKPQNLFVTSDGRDETVKVLDFGIAKLPGRSLTRTGRIVGTPAFMAPETWLGADVDARADVYALGAVMYFALTGRAPFSDETPLAVLARNALPQPPSAIRAGPRVPVDLEHVTMRCLAREPAMRFPDAGALVEVLRACTGAREPPQGALAVATVTLELAAQGSDKTST
jgi:serine/threonine-protein kinase